MTAGGLEPLDVRRHPLGRIVPDRRAPPDAAAPGRVGAVVGEAFSQDPHRLQPHASGQVAHERLLPLDEIRSRLGVLSVREDAAHRLHTAANPVARLEDRHLGTASLA